MPGAHSKPCCLNQATGCWAMKGRVAMVIRLWTRKVGRGYFSQKVLGSSP